MKTKLFLLAALSVAASSQAQVVREYNTVFWNTGVNTENVVSTVGGGLSHGGNLFGDTDPLLASTDIIVAGSWSGGFSSWVQAGGVYVIHDWGQSVPSLPGFGGVSAGTHTGADINVLDSAHPIVQGPFGTIDNTLLDGGSSSTHGAWLIFSLVSTDSEVSGIHSILSSDDANSAVVFEFEYGLGNIIYANIPLEAYTDSIPLVTGPQPAGLQVYAANELAYAASLLGDDSQPVPEVHHYASLLGAFMAGAEMLRRRRTKA